MADRAVLWVNDRPYEIALDAELLTSGRKAITRRLRPAELSDPGRIRHAFWATTGPMGFSRETPEGGLGTDYVVNVDHRFLLTSAPKRNTLDLSTADPSSAGFPLGAALGSQLGASISDSDVKVIQDDRGYIFASRGMLDTQVDPSTMAVVGTALLGGEVRGGTIWRDKGHLAMGSGVAVQRRSSVMASGAAYEDVVALNPAGRVYAEAIKATASVCAFVNADPGGSDHNKARFTVDAFETLSNPFPISDPTVPVTGMGALGPYIFAGHERGVASFTQAGDRVEYLRQLEGARSSLNGSQQVEQWGFLYVITERGVYALQTPGYARVGPERLPGFEGAVRGRPIAIGAVGDELRVTYLNENGDSHVIRGLFNPRTTPVSGIPDWYGFRVYTGAEVRALVETSLRTNPTELHGVGTGELSWYTGSTLSRDIDDPAYRFGVEAGDWYGSTLMQAPGMLKAQRMWRFFTRDCDASNAWTLSVLRDEDIDGNGYETVGAAVESNGMQTLRPASGGVPANVGFHRIKPRLTKASASDTTPPKVDGALELIYDERPDQVAEIVAVIALGQADDSPETQIAALEALAGRSGEPVAIRYPGADADEYGFVNSADRQDLKGSIQGLTVVVTTWPAQ